MKKIELTSGEYAAKWSLTDFYEGAEALLRAAIESGEDFSADYGCKKEIRYAGIVRDSEEVLVTVFAYMDDLYESADLIYDALWERMKVDEELSDEMINSIREAAIDFGIDDSTAEVYSLPRSASFEDICDVISQLEDQAEASNKAMFNELCDIVEAVWRDKK